MKVDIVRGTEDDIGIGVSERMSGSFEVGGGGRHGMIDSHGLWRWDVWEGVVKSG